MPLRRSLILLPAGLLLLGCSSAKVHSIPREGNTRKIDRLYILVDSAPNGSWNLLGELQAELVSRFERRGIPCKVHMRDLLAVQEKERLRSDLAAFAPHQILEISQTSVTRGGGPSGGTFDLTLLEPGNLEDPLWKASLETSGFNSAGSGGVTADEIIRTLVQDGLLDGTGGRR